MRSNCSSGRRRRRVGRRSCGSRRRPSRRWPLGTRASTLRMKCTRHRCQAAPSITAPIAFLRPRWCVGDHQPHAGQAAGAQRPEERGPERSVLAVADRRHPSTSRSPFALTPVAITTARETTWPPTRALSRWRRGTRTGTRHGPAAGPGTPPSRRPASAQIRDTSDLEIPDVGAQSADQVVDLAGRHAVDVGLHHHREQRHGRCVGDAPGPTGRSCRAAASGSSTRRRRPS